MGKYPTVLVLFLCGFVAPVYYEEFHVLSCLVPRSHMSVLFSLFGNRQLVYIFVMHFCMRTYVVFFFFFLFFFFLLLLLLFFVVVFFSLFLLLTGVGCGL